MKKIIALIAVITLSSFAYKPDKIQRRKGVMTVNENGKIEFKALEDWMDYTPKSDTVYQYKIY